MAAILAKPCACSASRTPVAHADVQRFGTCVSELGQIWPASTLRRHRRLMQPTAVRLPAIRTELRGTAASVGARCGRAPSQSRVCSVPVVNTVGNRGAERSRRRGRMRSAQKPAMMRSERRRRGDRFRERVRISGCSDEQRFRDHVTGQASRAATSSETFRNSAIRHAQVIDLRPAPSSSIREYICRGRHSPLPKSRALAVVLAAVLGASAFTIFASAVPARPSPSRIVLDTGSVFSRLVASTEVVAQRREDVRVRE